MRIFYVIIFFFLSVISLNAQIFNAQQVKGLPTEEVYDLFADSKGFLWVAHSLGISRYDGVSFTNFHNPQETSLGVTDIVEDKQGRIWFHNFNGQIFYIENERMNLLEEFKYAEESTFPRMAILENELIITSEKGLFICNTTNLKCHYLFQNINTNLKLSSLATIGGVIYKNDGINWISYKPGRGIRKVTFINNIYKDFTELNPALQPLITTDTIYAKDIKANVYKLNVRNDTVILSSVLNEKSYVNTVIACNKNIWINTKKESYTIDHSSKIENFNLTDIVIDHEGNTWYSSLQNGLLFQPKYKLWEEISINALQENDFVRSFVQQKNINVYGTQNGNIILKNNITGKTEFNFKMPSTAGSAERIFAFSEDEVLVCPSLGLYLVNTKKNKMYELYNQETVKDISIVDTVAFFAYARMLTRV